MNSRSESYKTPIHHMHFCPSMFQHLQPRPAQTTDAGAPRCVVSQVSWPREIAWQPTELRWPQGQMDMDLFVGKRDFVPPRQKGAFVVSGWLLDRNVFFLWQRSCCTFKKDKFQNRKKQRCVSCWIIETSKTSKAFQRAMCTAYLDGKFLTWL